MDKLVAQLVAGFATQSVADYSNLVEPAVDLLKGASSELVTSFFERTITECLRETDGQYISSPHTPTSTLTNSKRIPVAAFVIAVSRRLGLSNYELGEKIFALFRWFRGNSFEMFDLFKIK